MKGKETFTPVTVAAEAHRMAERVDYMTEALEGTEISLWGSDETEALRKAAEALRAAEASLVAYAAKGLNRT